MVNRIREQFIPQIGKENRTPDGKIPFEPEIVLPPPPRNRSDSTSSRMSTENEENSQVEGPIASGTSSSSLSAASSSSLNAAAPPFQPKSTITATAQLQPTASNVSVPASNVSTPAATAQLQPTASNVSVSASTSAPAPQPTSNPTIPPSKKQFQAFKTKSSTTTTDTVPVTTLAFQPVTASTTASTSAAPNPVTISYAQPHTVLIPYDPHYPPQYVQDPVTGLYDVKATTVPNADSPESMQVDPPNKQSQPAAVQPQVAGKTTGQFDDAEMPLAPPEKSLAVSTFTQLADREAQLAAKQQQEQERERERDRLRREEIDRSAAQQQEADRAEAARAEAARAKAIAEDNQRIRAETAKAQMTLQKNAKKAASDAAKARKAVDAKLAEQQRLKTQDEADFANYAKETESYAPEVQSKMTYAGIVQHAVGSTAEQQPIGQLVKSDTPRVETPANQQFYQDLDAATQNNDEKSTRRPASGTSRGTSRSSSASSSRSLPGANKKPKPPPKIPTYGKKKSKVSIGGTTQSSSTSQLPTVADSVQNRISTPLTDEVDMLFTPDRTVTYVQGNRALDVQLNTDEILDSSNWRQILNGAQVQIPQVDIPGQEESLPEDLKDVEPIKEVDKSA
ncbi:uncharacterized protein LOC135836453 [Planococcus citri]|uniref:uncharacterized protein LOC135836453 n=1 Tax=Planococcus citri TaxID=170843 RepID=UPI0031F8529E